MRIVLLPHHFILANKESTFSFKDKPATTLQHSKAYNSVRYLTCL